MLTPKVGFVVYGTHRGVDDPMGQPFIDQKVIDNCKKALKKEGLDLVETSPIVVDRADANKAILPLVKDDSIDAMILFSGTWIWAGEMIGAIREFAKTGKGIIVWTFPGSQGWRPVGGLVLKAALEEVGIPYRYVYGDYKDKKDLERITSYCHASALKNKVSNSRLGALGGRGMGQTCGVADPAQWMKTFGIDIDSRDTTDLIQTAKKVTKKELDEVWAIVKKRFKELPADDEQTERSFRIYVALKKLIKKNNWDYYTIQSFPGFGDDYGATCFAQSMILDDGIPTSTLSDFNTCLTSILVMYLSNDSIYYGDFQCIDKKKGEIKIIGDGACPTCLADKNGAVFATHGIPTEGAAGGISVSLTCKAGKGVLARVCRENGEFALVVTRAEVKVPAAKDLKKRKLECGIPFWPHAFVYPQCDIEELLQHWHNEYACLGYGEELYERLVAFGELTGMKVYAL